MAVSSIASTLTALPPLASKGSTPEPLVTSAVAAATSSGLPKGTIAGSSEPSRCSTTPTPSPSSERKIAAGPAITNTPGSPPFPSPKRVSRRARPRAAPARPRATPPAPRTPAVVERGVLRREPCVLDHLRVVVDLGDVQARVEVARVLTEQRRQVRRLVLPRLDLVAQVRQVERAAVERARGRLVLGPHAHELGLELALGYWAASPPPSARAGPRARSGSPRAGAGRTAWPSQLRLRFLLLRGRGLRQEGSDREQGDCEVHGRRFLTARAAGAARTRPRSRCGRSRSP